ncbi:MAG: PQQ-dependent sugar dehydrogenase, partial [Planctomycetota bacterium JB042]
MPRASSSVRLAAALSSLLSSAPFLSADPPDGFEVTTVVSGLRSPASLAFAPDGRMFVGERVEGRLRVAVPAAGGDAWTLLPTPFHTFDVPKGAGGTPLAHKSSGLRGFAFDPEFATNGHVHAFVMQDNPRHNRVVRITASVADANVSDGTETTLIDLPFNATGSSGSHNGGAVECGPDGRLYVTTGDGWSGGDPVQTLATFTGKVLRIERDGTIPSDNPFFGQTSGAHRAIF